MFIRQKMVFTLCFCALFSIFYTPSVYSEVKKPEMGTEKKTDCKECHSRSKMGGEGAKPTAEGQLTKEGKIKLTLPPDHIMKDKRKNKGQQ